MKPAICSPGAVFVSSSAGVRNALPSVTQLLTILPLALAVAACDGDARSHEEHALGRKGAALTGLGFTADVLGFELPVEHWSSNNAAVASSDHHIQAEKALGMTGAGYTLLESPALSTVSNVEPTIGFFVSIPEEQPNPSWFGDAQLFVDLPSQGLNNVWIGYQSLNGFPRSVFKRVSFELPSAVVQALEGSYSDLRLRVAMNVPSGGTYHLDDLAFGQTPPFETPLGPSESDLGVLKMEDTENWSVSAGTLSLSDETVAGSHSLALSGGGYVVLESAELSSLGRVRPNLAVHLKKPVNQVNPYWHGSLALAVHAPSIGLDNRWISQQELTELESGSFRQIVFTLPDDVVTALHGEYYDFRLRFLLNLPVGSLTHLVDFAYVPTEQSEAYAQCVALCESQLDLGCSATPSFIDCAHGCRFGVLHSGCSAEWAAAMTCSTSNAGAASCDPINGEPSYGCAAELAVFRDCIGPNPL
jgi:hypothetical protein